MKKGETKGLRVEISENTLKRLLLNNQVCAADLRCLDCISKKCLWRLCLESCAAKTEQDRKVQAPAKAVARPKRVPAPRPLNSGASNIRFFPLHRVTPYRKERAK
jgi:hypothetical protein